MKEKPALFDRKFLCGIQLLFSAVLVDGCAAISTQAISSQPFEQLTNWVGDENAPSISPDGHHMAFHASVGGANVIYVQDLANGKAKRLPNATSSDRRPTWAPDGVRLAFISNRGGSPGIWVASADGADARLLFKPVDGQRISGRPFWSPDGARITTTLIDPNIDGNPNWGGAIVAAIDVETGALTRLTTGGDEWWPHWDPNSEWLYYYVGITDDIEAVHSRTGDIRFISKGRYVGWRPIVSPDGKSLLFVSEATRWSIFIAPIDGSHTPLRLTRTGNDDIPTFSPDGASIVFSSDRSQSSVVEYDIQTGERNVIDSDGLDPQETAEGEISFLRPAADTREIVVFDRSTKSTRTLSVATKPVLELAYSPEGDRIAVVTSSFLANDYHVKLLDSNGVMTGASLQELVKSESPVWCGDNETLLFSARKIRDKGFRQIWAYDNETRTSTQITNSPLSKRPTDCSSDGRKLAFHLTGGASGLRVIEKQTSGEWEETLSISGREGNWSPDGKHFAYVDQKDGQTDIFIRDADGKISQITNDKLQEVKPRWSRDGRRLLFSALAPNRDLWKMRLPDLPWNGQ